MPEGVDQHADGLLPHLSSLYLLAQSVTMDATAASALVERTYRRAYDTPPDAWPADRRSWLFSLMLEQHAKPPEPPAQPATTDAGDLHRRLAERFVDRTLPMALATLPGTLRLLLVLTYVEKLPPDKAGDILGLEPDHAASRLEQARAALERALWTSATPAERYLMNSSLTGDWLPGALRRTIQNDFVPVPPTLRQAVEAAGGASAANHPSELPARAARKPGTDGTGLVPRLHRALVAIALVFAAGLSGLAVSEFFRAEPEVNLIALSASHAGSVRPTVFTSDSGEAERFVRNRLDWRMRLPEIEGAVLVGVGTAEVTTGVQVPVFVFEDAETRLPITLYTYSYALLDRFNDRIQLERDMLNQIEEEQHFDLYDEGADKVLVWRHRDDIFVAVTRADAESLSERISFPS